MKMIRETRDYWVVDGNPSKEDIVVAVEEAKKHGCDIMLHWKGPGYMWHGDTYQRLISSDTNPDEMFDSLPKVYGV